MRSILKSGLAEKILEAGFITHQLPLEKFEEGFNAIKNGEAEPVQIAGFLVGLRMKGETAHEIAGCAKAIHEVI